MKLMRADVINGERPVSAGCREVRSGARRPAAGARRSLATDISDGETDRLGGSRSARIAVKFSPGRAWRPRIVLSSRSVAGDARRPSTGFTLIELLIVISVIAILASLIFPVTKAITRNRIKTRATTERDLVVSAIESYKAKLGHYPPDNGNNYFTNQLYYELVGAVYNNNGLDTTRFAVSDGSSLAVSTFTATFSPVAGIVNFTPKVDKEEGSATMNFLKKGLNPLQVQTTDSGVRFLTSTVKWPVTMTTPPGFIANYCVWRYNSTSPTNNPGAFDLWVDVLIDGRTNRICNWSRDPFVVSTPYE